MLFVEANERQKRKKSYDSTISDAECTFHPNILLTKIESARGKISDPLFTLGKRHNNNNNEQPENQQQYSFKPTIKRGPLVARQKGPIWEYLYTKSKIHKRNKTKDDCSSIARKNSSIKSGNIIEQLKYNCFLKIFQLLNTDKNDVLQFDKIDLACIFSY